MAEQSFGELATGMRFRDLVKKIAVATVNEIRPRYQYAEVISIDRANYQCTVTYVGDSSVVRVGMGSIQPMSVGQKVRVEGIGTDKFITEVYGPCYPVIQTAAAGTNTLQTATTAFVQTAIAPVVPTEIVATNGQVINFASTYPTIKRAVMLVQGGGGGGGGAVATAAGQASGGGGAGGGGYAEVEFYPALLAGAVTVTVGAAGTGSAGAAGSAGGNSVVTDGTTTVTANGGGGGATPGAQTPPNRTNGSGSGGTASITGSTTPLGRRILAAGDSGDLGSLLSIAAGYSGQGGRAGGGGRGGSPVGVSSDGLSGTAGGGGSGGANAQSQGTARQGGDGVVGFVRFYLYTK